MAKVNRAHQWQSKRSEQGARAVCIVCGAVKTPGVNPVCWIEETPEPAIITEANSGPSE